jgi:ABC-type antimicrobial peptide transport system permease subunit
LKKKKKKLMNYAWLTLREIKQNKVGYTLGFLSCLLVVVVVALLMSLLAQAPLIMTKIAETRDGEIDVVLGAGQWTGYSYLNYSRLENVLPRGRSSPRHLWSSDRCRIAYARGREFDPRRIYSFFRPNETDACFGHGETVAPLQTSSAAHIATVCFDHAYPKSVGVNLLVLDSMREARMGLGRSWPFSAVDAGSVLLSRSLARSLGLGDAVRVGDSVTLAVNMDAALGDVWRDVVVRPASSGASVVSALARDDEAALLESARSMYAFAPFRVAGIYESAAGKHASSLERAAVVELGALMRWLAEHLHPALSDAVRARAASLRLADYAPTVAVNVAEPRYALYADADVDAVQHSVVEFASQLVERAGGAQSVRAQLPILHTLEDTLRWFSLFLGVILNVVVALLLFLSSLLIYSLLMVSVETRTRQLGILRMIGMRRSQLVRLLLTQALGFAVPSVCVGLALAQLGLLGAAAAFDAWAGQGASMPASLSAAAALTAAALGLCVPLLASVAPIAAALSRNVHDSIGSTRAAGSQQQGAVEVSAKRNSAHAVPLPALTVGVLLVVLGGSIYYLVPLALLSTNLALLLNLFLLLLAMMMLGLVTLALNAQHMLERAVVFALLCVERVAVRAVVLKNLVAHRRRNQLTTLMFALSLAFIIFLYVSYDVQINSLLYQEQQQRGALLVVEGRSPSARIGAATLAALEAYVDASPHVERGTALSGDVARARSGIWPPPRLLNVGMSVGYDQSVVGVQPSLFRVALDGFAHASRLEDARWLDGDLAAQLYSARGSTRALVGAAYSELLGADEPGDPLLLALRYSSVAGHRYSGTALHRIAASAYMDACPALFFSRYPLLAGATQNLAVSLTTLARLADLGSVDEVPLERFLARTASDDDAALDRVASDLRQIVRLQNVARDGRLGIYDYRDSLEPIEQANVAMLFFFGATIAIAMFVAFFALASSMLTNVREQSREIGVMRALGLPDAWLARIYIYEAFVVVFSSSLLGILIGTLVGWTVSLQRVLFTSLPVPFHFPFVPLLIVVGLSALLAFIAAYAPIRQLMRQRIVSNLSDR